jgi:hypothetical protein
MTAAARTRCHVGKRRPSDHLNSRSYAAARAVLEVLR